MVDSALERFGRLDVIVANAGVQHVSAIAEFPEDKWDLLISLMLTSPFLLARYALGGAGRVPPTAGSSPSPLPTRWPRRPTSPPTCRPSTACWGW